MKKIGLLLGLCLAVAANAQNNSSTGASSGDSDAPQGTLSTRVSFPIERVQTPTYADLYCAGFMTKQLPSGANFVGGGLQTPSATKYVDGDIVYLMGSGYQLGQQYSLVRELKDPNRYELFKGQHAMMKETGQAYEELGRVRVVDARSKTAIGQLEFTCDTVNPGDLAVPFAEKQPISFHPPLRFDRFVPANGKVGGRIVLARDFSYELGTGTKVYLNVGASQGVKAGDYFRAVRNYSADLRDPVDSLSFKASAAEDTQMKPPSVDARMFTKNAGPMIHVADFPRRAVGELVILSTTPTTSTAMVVFALEDVRAGDRVEMDDQQ
jgi:hypothetical protein